MRYGFILFVFLLSATVIKAQNSYNYLQLFTNTGLNFNLSSPADVENLHTIPNALTLKVKTQSTCSVYVRVSAYNVPSGFYPPDSPLQLDWTSDTSPSESGLLTAPFDLQTYDQKLFSQVKTGSYTYSYNYNLLLEPVGYDYPPGNYNFTLMFTMTQP